MKRLTDITFVISISILVIAGGIRLKHVIWPKQMFPEVGTLMELKGAPLSNGSVWS